ncbi:MAG: hypothetical protein EA401_09140 [Planctomycetota bacterium]|nr:MAG: hypothetical protein EA401_09140 [Planctomycetota bacterium]
MLYRIVTFLALLGAIHLAALQPLMAQQGSAQIERLVERFEHDLERAFMRGRNELEQFRNRQAMQAAVDLSQYLNAAESADDQIYVAWHLLSLNPRHAAARTIFDEHEIDLPLNQRLQFAPKQAPPPPDNRDLVRIIHEQLYPKTSDVIAVAQSAVRSYTRANTNSTRTFIRSLVRLRSDAEMKALVDPILAFYFPAEAKQAGIRPNPDSRNWLNPVDRYLLEYGLLSCEAGYTPPLSGSISRSNDQDTLTSNSATSWQFPIPLAHWSMEIVANQGHSGQATVSRQAGGSGITVSWNDNGDVTIKGNGIDLGYQLGTGPHYLQVVATGGQWAIAINGGQVASGSMQRQAWQHFRLGDKSSAYAAQVRYLSANSHYLATLAPGVTLPLALQEPEPEPTTTDDWRAALQSNLEQQIRFAFNDVPLDDVVAALNQLSELNWHLDQSAEPLSTLPLNLSGEGMTGNQLLGWFERLAGLSYRLEERGVVLLWQ